MGNCVSNKCVGTAEKEDHYQLSDVPKDEQQIYPVSDANLPDNDLDDDAPLSDAPRNVPAASGGDDGTDGNVRRPTVIQREYRDDYLKGGGKDGDERRGSNLSSYSTESQHVVERPVRVGSFNAKKFGRAKMRDAAVASILVRIIRRFDILCLIEVTDSSGEAADELLKMLNKKGDEYEMESSPRLGTNTNNKEQIVFFYRADRFMVKSSQVFDDPDAKFSRPVKFGTKALEGNETIVLIGVHVQPKSAVSEIDALSDVADAARSKFRTTNVFALGDLNAGGGYVNTSDWPKIRLRSEKKRFDWLIADHVDTTSAATNAAYDRIVACGRAAREAVVPGTAGAFRFDDAFDLPADLTQRVSDHYPVEVVLKPRTHHEVLENVAKREAVILEDVRTSQVEDYAELLRTLERSEDFDFKILSDQNRRLDRYELIGRFPTITSTTNALLQLRSSTKSQIISYSLISMLRKHFQDFEVNSLDESVIISDVQVRIEMRASDWLTPQRVRYWKRILIVDYDVRK